jgi:hypothetical protein
VINFGGMKPNSPNNSPQPGQPQPLKTNCNLVYTHLANMMEFIKGKYQKLLEQDPTEYRQFIFHKRTVVDLVATILSQLDGKHVEVVKSAQHFVSVAHNLHQYIVQLVIDQKVPQRGELEEMVSRMPPMRCCLLLVGCLVVCLVAWYFVLFFRSFAFARLFLC